jgi:probable F420-dependent oxidoreductase
MRIGVVFPQTEFSNDPAVIKDYAQTAEGLGYTHILAYDHILGANPERPGGWHGPYTHQDPFHEVFSLFSFMAAVTEKIEFATGVLVLPQRNTVLAAKQAAQLDVLSGGRLRLGIGIGWNAVEYHGLGKNFGNRGKRIEQQIKLMRELWTKPLVTNKGKRFDIQDAGINPLPVQQPIPIWFGGHHENVLRRVGQLGDGWMPGFRQAEEAKPSLAIIAKYAQDAARNPAKIGLEPRINYAGADEKVWQNTMQDWQEVGATHISINTMNANLDTPEKHIQAIRRFASAVGLGEK